jgi:protein kinase A
LFHFLTLITLFDVLLAKFVEDKTFTLCGTPNYLSPEVIMNRGHGASTDHWALGVLIYEMVAGENPFFYDGMPQMELFQCIVREKFYPLPDEVSDECFYMVDELLEKDPNQRLGSLAGHGKGKYLDRW